MKGEIQLSPLLMVLGRSWCLVGGDKDIRFVEAAVDGKIDSYILLPPHPSSILRGKCLKGKCCEKQCVQFMCIYDMYMFLCIYVAVHFQSSLGSYHLRSEKLIIILWFFCPINVCRPSSYLLEHLWNHHFVHVNPCSGKFTIGASEGQLVENPGKLLWIPFSFSWFSVFSLIKAVFQVG